MKIIRISLKRKFVVSWVTLKVKEAGIGRALSTIVALDSVNLLAAHTAGSLSTLNETPARWLLLTIRQTLEMAEKKVKIDEKQQKKGYQVIKSDWTMNKGYKPS